MVNQNTNSIEVVQNILSLFILGISLNFMQEDISSTKSLTALLCQNLPVLHKKQQNIATFSEKLNFYSQEDLIDIIIFPEMSFTGYNFKNYEDALVQAVFYGHGDQFEYASGLAKKLNCYVLFGYVEKIEEKGKIVLYNSAAIVSRSGQPVFNTHKTHLYDSDEAWSEEGSGFKRFELVGSNGGVFGCGVGICMDISEKKFISKEYEFGEFICKEKCDVILLLMNWVHSPGQSFQEKENHLRHWYERLRPVVNLDWEVVVLVANRIGEEYSYCKKEVVSFVGCSCCFTLNPYQIRATILPNLVGTLKVIHLFSK